MIFFIMRKKILQISNYFYPNIGGIEQTARDIANSLKKAGFEQKIICFNENSGRDNYVCHRNETVHDTVDDIEVIRCGCAAKIASQSVSFTFGRELKNVMENFKPDIVIFHYPNPFEASYLLKYLNSRIKFILYWHLDIMKQKLLGKFFHFQTVKLLKRADRIIATSPLYIDGSPYLRKYKEKCNVIPSCINENRIMLTEEIRELAQKIRAANKDRIICFEIGRHVAYKGFRYLIEASKFLDQRFKIFIAGKGDLTEKLQRQARNDEKIIFLGRISDKDLAAYYLAMDIFCFPSITKNEAFGLALAEAMYYAKPSVTFNIPGSGVNYVCLNGENCIEVENRNVYEYAKAMITLADNPDLRVKMGLAARKRAEENFLTPRFSKNILRVIEGL